MVSGTPRRTEPLRLQSVTARYGLRRRPVFTAVSLTLPPGEVTAILGDNGSGKSTLLRIVAGAVRPSGGKVIGRPHPVGYVPDWFPPHPRMSALTYLTHLGRVAGMPGEAARRRAADLLERLGFLGEPSAPVDLLSKGNAQKVAIAQSVLANPLLLVLDEPWNGLDLQGQRVLRELITERCLAGAVVVIADHREAFVSGTAQMYHMADGELRQLEGLPLAPQQIDDDEAMVLIEVTDLPPGNRDLPGAVSATVDGEVLRVRVPRLLCDHVLFEVLQLGGSVLRVVPEVTTKKPGKPAPRTAARAAARERGPDRGADHGVERDIERSGGAA